MYGHLYKKRYVSLYPTFSECIYNPYNLSTSNATNTHTNYIPELSCCLHETLSGPWLGNDALSGQVDRTSGVFLFISKGLRGFKTIGVKRQTRSNSRNPIKSQFDPGLF